MATLNYEIEKLALLQGVQVLQAYAECSNEVQAEIRGMVAILRDPNTDEDDRNMTLITLADALFPSTHGGELGVDLEESESLDAKHSEEMRAAIDEMDREEIAFAARLRNAMESQGVTQEQLAAKTGVGQPAISNILNRQCRPQKRTVRRFAEALGVPADELWPGCRD